MANNNPTPSADTRSRFDREIEQRLAERELRLEIQRVLNNAATGHTFDTARSVVKNQKPRLVALADGLFDLDAELAAAGQPDPFPHLRS